MARALRIEYPGAVYHVMARGNHGQGIFQDDGDRRILLKAVMVEAEADDYFQVVSTYIHLNPARAKLIRIGQERLKVYAWSSYPLYLRQKAPPWLERGRVLGNLRLSKAAPEKTALAGWLRERTTVSLRWVTERLGMGHYQPGGAGGGRLEPAADAPAAGIGGQVAEVGMREIANAKGEVHNYRTDPTDEQFLGTRTKAPI